ncbi:MAG: divergent polysaccharide deacetylase family protein [Acetobacteraceae bacterium]|nr:divergent polysaccharide deacetylase family protein [Acetobacteraceae bacterium]
MFWLVVVTLTCSLASLLIWLGPVREAAAPIAASSPSPPAVAPAPPAGQAVPLLPHPPPVDRHPMPVADISARGRALARPDAALLEPAPHIPGGFLPRIARDGRTPMQVYAAGFDAQDHRPRVAILIAGVGMNVAESAAAVEKLPGAVSLAVSPYANRLDDLLDHARNAGHELLISLPMEPAGYPLNDPGHHALLTGASMSENAQRLEWAITRFSGFVGATGALGTLRGERFAASLGQMASLFDTLAERGLLYVDPRPNARLIGGARQSAIAYRGVDLVVDDVAANGAGAEAIDAALARLEKLAQGRGAAIGLVSQPSPLVVDRLGVWAVGLAERGLALAPVSAVVQMPQAP